MLVLIFVAVVVDFKVVVVVVKPTTGNVCVVPPVSAANKAEISLKIQIVITYIKYLSTLV